VLFRSDELQIDSPPVGRLDPSFTVRLPDQQQIHITANADDLHPQLRQVFPECAEAAVGFYQQLTAAGLPDSRPAAALLNDSSYRFQRFIDLQLQTFTGMSAVNCPLHRAASALDPRREFVSISGGGQALVDSLVAAVNASGGSVRVNAPVLRLAFDNAGLPAGVDLLNGERVHATRAVISNLTVWDTFGKLVGMSHTPPALSTQLKKLHGWGVYLMFLEVAEATAARLPFPRLLVLNKWEQDEPFDPEHDQFMFAMDQASQTATVSTFTRAEDWFSFHEDHTSAEAQDQAMLESLWSRLHTSMPELGDGVEIIETATPQTFYETARRKFGMTGPAVGPVSTDLIRPYPNLFLVGDTAGEAFGYSGAAESAYLAANEIAPIQQ